METALPGFCLLKIALLFPLVNAAWPLFVLIPILSKNLTKLYQVFILISVKKLNPVRGFLSQAKEVPTTRAKKAR